MECNFFDNLFLVNTQKSLSHQANNITFMKYFLLIIFLIVRMTRKSIPHFIPQRTQRLPGVPQTTKVAVAFSQVNIIL
jgi:hypothetical protein